MSGPIEPATIWTMPTYWSEVHMSDAGAFELERATRMLVAAQSRMRRQATFGRTTFASLSRDDGRLVYLVEAGTLESARRMLSFALLPPGRIRETTNLANPHLLRGRHP
jgi:hypothetical protein